MIMKLRSLKFYFKEAFNNLSRNKLMAFASVITVMSCILIFSVSFYFVENINFALEKINSAIGLSVIIKDDLPDEKVDMLKKKISELVYVKKIDFVSSEQALKNFMETFEDSKEILAGLKEDNPLPRSFDILLLDNKFYEDAIKACENLKDDGVEKVKHALAETNVLMSISKILHIVSAVMIFLLGIISIVIIINTIRLAVNSRREEIIIMKYIGATNWFIRWPFIIEGMIIGFVGSVIPVLICWPCYEKIIEFIYIKMSFMKKIFEFKSGLIIFSELLPIALSLGLFIGIVGSVSSVKKYLDV